MEQGPEQTITDIRGREADFDTDEHGFAVAKWGFPRDIDYASVSEVEGRYREEVERMLRKTVGGVDEVVCFNWKVGLIFSFDLEGGVLVYGVLLFFVFCFLVKGGGRALSIGITSTDF